MELITAALPTLGQPACSVVDVPVDRLTLAKRRWRGVAANGREFGFDLEHPLHDGDAVCVDQGTVYRLAQQPEPVLTVELHDPAEAARLGWLLGNLHFRLAVTAGAVQAPDDPAVRQMLEREQVAYRSAEAVFHPLGGGHSHGHPAH